MDNYEIRFGYLRVLTEEEKLEMISELENDIEELNSIIKNPATSSEQKSELNSDIANESSKLEYLKSIVNEKSL